MKLKLIISLFLIILVSGCVSLPSAEEALLLMGDENKLLMNKLSNQLSSRSEAQDVIVILGEPYRSFGRRYSWIINQEPPTWVFAYFGIFDDKLCKVKFIGLDPTWRIDIEY